MSCTDNTSPISGGSSTVTIEAAAAKDLATLGVSINPNAERITVSFNLAGSGKRDPIARLARDSAFTPTATDGEPVIQARRVELTKDQFTAKFIATDGDVDVFVEQFELET